MDASLDLLFLASDNHLIGVAEIFSAVPPRTSAEKWPTLKDPLLGAYFEAEEKAYSVPATRSSSRCASRRGMCWGRRCGSRRA